MRYSKSALSLAERFEGCELKAYQDQGGVWTIGYGHTAGVCEGMTETLQKAEDDLARDIEQASVYVNLYVKVELTQDEFDALTDFVFNLGCENFKSSTLLQLLNEGKISQAAQQFDRWDRCGGTVVAGLLRRRSAEEELFQSSEKIVTEKSIV